MRLSISKTSDYRNNKKIFVNRIKGDYNNEKNVSYNIVIYIINIRL